MVAASQAEAPTKAFLVRLLVEEESLYGLLLVERAVVPAFLLVWMAFSGSGRLALISASAFVGWELVTSLAMRSRLGLLKSNPALLLSIEQAAGTAVFLGVGSWRGSFYYTLASPTVLAAIFVGSEFALAFAGVASVIVVASIGLLHMPDGRGPRGHTTIQDWAGAPPLFVAAAVLVSFARRLLDRVATMAQRADAMQAELNRMRQEAAEEHARRALTSEFHGDVRQALTSLPARWRTLASMPAVAGAADLLRDGASIAEKGSAKVKALLVSYRPASPSSPTAIPLTEGVDVLTEVDEQERGYFKAIVIARLLFAVYLGAFLIDSGSRLTFAIAVWLALLIWVVCTSVAWKQLFARLKERPSLLLLEQGVGVAALLCATTRNGNAFWVMGATAAVLATAVGTALQATTYVIISALAALASIRIAQHMGWQAPPSASGTFAATLGYLAPALPALYVRFLLDRLRMDGQRLRSQAEEAERLRLDIALDQVRRSATPRLIEQVRPVVDGLKARLSAISTSSDALIMEKTRLIELEDALHRLESNTWDRAFDWRDPLLEEVIAVALNRLRALGGAADAPTVVPRLRVPVARAEPLAELLAEALANAFRHGRPPVEVHAEAQDGDCVIVVDDHGTGFDVGEELARNGLWILRRYEELAKGRAVITSGSSGTRVRIEFSV